MENKAHAIAAGAFVLLASALLVALAVWLTRDTAIRKVYDISTTSSVTGLQQEASVRFRGVKVGKVTDIGFDTQVPGNVLVRIAVDSATPVTRSTFASLGFQGVTGIAFVQLDDSGQSPQALATDDALPARIPMRAGLMDQLSTQGMRILSELEESSRRFNQLLSPENQKALAESLQALGRAAASMPPAMEEASSAFKSMRESAATVSASANEVRQSAANFRQLTQRVQQAGGTLDQLQQGSASLADLGQDVQHGALPRFNRALDEVSQTTRQLGRAATTLTDNPQTLLYGPARRPPGPGEPGFVAPGGKP